MDNLKYHCRIMSVYNSYWSSIDWDLQRERRKWGLFSCLLVQKGADTRPSRRFYMPMVQSVLIFGL